MLHRYLLALVIVALCACQTQTTATTDQTIEHIVFIWLKEPGNTQAQDRIIKASQTLTTIPGMISLKSGRAVPSQRKIVDSSYDVALIFSFTNKAALDAYLAHPEHKKLLQETMLPLVDRIKVYDVK